ncbi:MAG: class I poly(R)-hydroxyalkanoic acid synthase [Pigmentiphaga sp.]|uniref:class I poly(R)-hydroxyalkanoic acid synthase n=1 Tax=Pigmentiphaga sp. TaxID=1977564 RepID=UPI0029ADA62F|nr:class I poly(R)-hydroxyalkanoic acid synthase [Pigmentiphaga sp.]MDX3905302.1 class I poly(R)-hydroxyalkanoic acid synthase [Pigmentiphaga sp.]
MPELPNPILSSGQAPEKLLEIQREFTREWTELWQAAARGELASPADQRFSGDDWRTSPVHAFLAHAYLLSARTLLKMADSIEAPEPVLNRLRFATMQWLDAMAPSNFLAFNPEAQRRLLESGGESLQQGLANLLADLQKGRISQTDESSFEVGRNLATTEGAVVFENRLFQLIQYKPLATRTYARPLLMVPPCINKYYILDLQPQNSFVRFALEQGLQVFMVSWRNPLPADQDGVQHADWDDYLEEGVLEAIKAVSAISRQDRINALGFCVGGTLLASALAVAKGRGQDPVASLTLLTTLLDFTDTGVLDVFVDEAQVMLREQQFAGGGVLAARELAATFAFLRPNDLVWNYVVNNYLKGQSPPAFDLLYWNADGTNLPGPFYAWYLRHTYLENNLRAPGKLRVCGVPLDFGRLDMPAYVYGSREDHIVPWSSAYASTTLLRGPMRFVLGASGHIAGVINPAARNRRSYWARDDDDRLPASAADWLDTARECPGSWWNDWAQWIQTYGGRQVKARTALGSAAFPVIEPAPGRYVRVRAT